MAREARVARVARVGKVAPPFELPDHNGEIVSLSSFLGRTVVLFFYPKDLTSGCTVQACEFRDLLPSFDELGAVVIGISPDPMKSHQKFRAKHELPYTLLSDVEHKVLKRYGVWVEKMLYGRRYMGVERTTIIVGPDGVITHLWRKVKHEGNAAMVEEALREALATR